MSEPTQNGVLRSLLIDEAQGLGPYLEPITLPKGKLLYDHGDVLRYGYFPVSGMLSLLALTEEGAVIQVAMVSSDGFAGLPIVLRTPATSQVVVQLAGHGYRVRSDILLREFMRAGAFQRAVLQQIDRLLSEAARALLCHRYHSVRQRFCRWLLTARDCVHVDTIELTQEHIAELLAIPRSAVSMTAAALQERGLLRQRHGRIQILKPRGIEPLACECYRVLSRRDVPDNPPMDRLEHRVQTKMLRAPAVREPGVAADTKRSSGQR